jgi:NAD-dependent DNA ligase
MTHTKLIYMDALVQLVQQITKANEAYRNGQTLLMTDEEYDAAVELLSQKVPNHPLLKKIRAPSTNGAIVKMPYYLGSLDKAKTGEELLKWLKKSPIDSKYLISEKLDGISGLWNPKQSKLYLSADDTTGVDVSSWLNYISVSSSKMATDIPDVWIRGELILPRSKIPAGRLGRSIVNGIFHHKIPNPSESAAVRFVGYEIMGIDSTMTVSQQFGLLEKWSIWLPWFVMATDTSSDILTEMLHTRRLESEYEMDGLVIKMNYPLPRVSKGNPKDALAWKPPNGEAKLTKVVQVEWNASATGKLVPRVQVNPVHLGGSTITYVSGVNARRIVDWKIGPGATVIIRKGGDVIPVIDRVEVAATVVFPAEGTWEWDGEASTAVNIKQKIADSTTHIAQLMKMVNRLNWENVGPAQMKAVVEAGYSTVPLLRKVTQEKLVELLGPVKGANLYKLVQNDGWSKATESDLFVASPVCPSGIGKTKLDALLSSEVDMTKWSSKSLNAPRGWSAEALKEFQNIWIAYEIFRKSEWSFLPYPLRLNPVISAAPEIKMIGSIVFTGFRDAAIEVALAAKGYKLVDAVKSDTKFVFIADKEDPDTYTSTKIEKAKKIPGCRILRKAEWIKI